MINPDEQWKLGGHCNECRRKRYCGTECKQHKESLRRELYRVIAKKMDEGTHGVFSQIMNRRTY